MTRAPASAAPPGCARARLGSRPRWCNAPGPAHAKRAATSQAQFQRLRHRRGPKKAVCAVAASILTAAYHMLRDGTVYQDLGPDHLRRATPEAQASRLARQITKLGFTCTLAPADKPISV